MKRLIVLRPQPGASASCTAARQLGLEPVALPLFRIEPVTWSAPDPAQFDALLLTSANAVRHAGAELSKLRGLPAYAVGEATAAEAREAGLTIASIGSGGVDALLERVEPELRLLHLCGEQRREPASARQPIRALPVYRAADVVPPPRLDALADSVVAIHSPRAAARLAEIAAAEGLNVSRTAVAAISAEAARSAGGGWQTLAVADEPSDAALLALAARLCNNRAER